MKGEGRDKRKVKFFSLIMPSRILSYPKIIKERKEQRDAFVDVFCWYAADSGLFLEAVCTDRAD